MSNIVRKPDRKWVSHCILKIIMLEHCCETQEKVGLPPHLQDHNVGTLLGNKREWALPNIIVHIEDK